MSIKEFFKSVLYKLQSVKVWIAIWAMFIITYIVLTRQTNFSTLTYILAAVPLSYCGLNVLQDYIFKKD